MPGVRHGRQGLVDPILRVQATALDRVVPRGGRVRAVLRSRSGPSVHSARIRVALPSGVDPGPGTGIVFRNVHPERALVRVLVRGVREGVARSPGLEDSGVSPMPEGLAAEIGVPHGRFADPAQADQIGGLTVLRGISAARGRGMTAGRREVRDVERGGSALSGHGGYSTPPVPVPRGNH